MTDENLVAVSFTQREAEEEEEKRPDPNNNKSAVITITNQSDILRSREDRRELIESDERNVKSGKQTTNTHLVTNQNNVASLFFGCRARTFLSHHSCYCLSIDLFCHTHKTVRERVVTHADSLNSFITTQVRDRARQLSACITRAARYNLNLPFSARVSHPRRPPPGTRSIGL